MTKKTKIYLLLPLLAFLASCSSTQTEMDEELASLKEGKIELAKAFVANMKYKVSVTPLNGQLLRNTFKVTRSDLQTLLAQGSDADDTYYVISEIQGFNTNRRYFKLEK